MENMILNCLQYGAKIFQTKDMEHFRYIFRSLYILSFPYGSEFATIGQKSTQKVDIFFTILYCKHICKKYTVCPEKNGTT